jgi:phosphatidylserine decarboxylase
MCIVGEQSALLSAVCWDKDRFGKDYMGELEVAMEDIFANGQLTQEVRVQQSSHMKLVR